MAIVPDKTIKFRSKGGNTYEFSLELLKMHFHYFDAMEHFQGTINEIKVDVSDIVLQDIASRFNESIIKLIKSKTYRPYTQRPLKHLLELYKLMDMWMVKDKELLLDVMQYIAEIIKDRWVDYVLNLNEHDNLINDLFTIYQDDIKNHYLKEPSYEELKKLEKIYGGIWEVYCLKRDRLMELYINKN